MVSGGHNVGAVFLGGSVSGSLRKLQSSCQLGMQCSEALTGAGRSTSKHGSFTSFLARVLVSSLGVRWSLISSPQRPLHRVANCLPDVAADFLQNDEWWGREEREKHLSWKLQAILADLRIHMPSLLLYAIGHRPTLPSSMWEKTKQDYEHWETTVLGGHCDKQNHAPVWYCDLGLKYIFGLHPYFWHRAPKRVI